jgi:L-malate glycosyltransferase
VAEAPLRILAVGDGQSRHLIRWARRLVDRGHEVHVVSNRISSRPNELDGITAHRYSDLDPRMKIRGLRRFWFSTALRELARRVQPDIVHSHYLLPHGYWAARAGLQPLVVSPWGKEAIVDVWNSPAGRRRAEAAIAPGRRFVINSFALERASVRLGADPALIRRILWHANIDDYSPARADRAGLRARHGWPQETPVVLSLRNFRPYTNLDVLLRAFAQVVREEPAARLLSSAGGGWTRDETERLIDELGLRSHVAIEEVDARDLPAVVASADLVVTLADVDSSPASLLESMASGLPIVCGIAPSMDEWVQQDEGAEMVERRDVDAVAAAMLKLIRDPDLRRRYGQRNEREVRSRFGDPGAELESVYREVLAG